MITIEYCRLMVRYNRWQNSSLVTAADELTDGERWLPRAAFFGSIAATLNHLLWDDALWLARFSGDEKPETRTTSALDAPAEWIDYKTLRVERDETLIAWADGLDDVDLEGDLGWYPGGSAHRICKAKKLCMIHLFNHQAHHRGQVHAMLTAAGVRPEPTDLPMLTGFAAR